MPSYAVIPIDDDPIYTFPCVNSISIATSPSASTPRVTLRFGNNTAAALIDTGASITVMRLSLAEKLDLQYDERYKISFTTANNQSNQSLGVVRVSCLLGELPVVLTCHVVNELAHEVIIGYPDLKALRAVIDTASNEVRIPKAIPGNFSGGSPLGSSTGVPVVASVCSMAATLRLPGFHHAYIDIHGPANQLAFVSTPQDVTLEKLLSVAAGIVQFDASGMATVKIANLNTTDVIINKGQHIASYEYLPSSFELHSISSKNPSFSSPPS
ncbi:hypothetical protein BD770DRAFT_403670, partial [Pilaira anomala]